jgi:hypothetical protein
MNKLADILEQLLREMDALQVRAGRGGLGGCVAGLGWGSCRDWAGAAQAGRAGLGVGCAGAVLGLRAVPGVPWVQRQRRLVAAASGAGCRYGGSVAAQVGS